MSTAIQKYSQAGEDFLTVMANDNDAYIKFLKFQGTIFKQATNVALEFFLQNPNARFIASKEQWQNMKCSVKLGEDCIRFVDKNGNYHDFYDITQVDIASTPRLWSVNEKNVSEIKDRLGINSNSSLVSGSVNQLVPNTDISECIRTLGYPVPKSQLKSFVEAYKNGVKCIVAGRLEVGGNKINDVNADSSFLGELRPEQKMHLISSMSKSARTVLYSIESIVNDINEIERSKQNELRSMDEANRGRNGESSGQRITGNSEGAADKLSDISENDQGRRSADVGSNTRNTNEENNSSVSSSKEEISSGSDVLVSVRSDNGNIQSGSGTGGTDDRGRTDRTVRSGMDEEHGKELSGDGRLSETTAQVPDDSKSRESGSGSVQGSSGRTVRADESETNEFRGRSEMGEGENVLLGRNGNERESISPENRLTADSQEIFIEGYDDGTYSVIDTVEIDDTTLYILESDNYGADVGYMITDENRAVLITRVPKNFIYDIDSLSEIEEYRDSNNEYIGDLGIAKKYINQFTMSEYGSKSDFSNLSEVSILYTTLNGTSDDSIEIQVIADLENYSLNTYLNSKLVKEYNYSSLKEMISDLEDLDFDSLIQVDSSEKINAIFEDNPVTFTQLEINGDEYILSGQVTDYDTISEEIDLSEYGETLDIDYHYYSIGYGEAESASNSELEYIEDNFYDIINSDICEELESDSYETENWVYKEDPVNKLRDKLISGRAVSTSDLDIMKDTYLVPVDDEDIFSSVLQIKTETSGWIDINNTEDILNYDNITNINAACITNDGSYHEKDMSLDTFKVLYNRSNSDNLDYAAALSIHKSRVEEYAERTNIITAVKTNRNIKLKDYSEKKNVFDQMISDARSNDFSNYRLEAESNVYTLIADSENGKNLILASFGNKTADEIADYLKESNLRFDYTYANSHIYLPEYKYDIDLKDNTVYLHDENDENIEIGTSYSYDGKNIIETTRSEAIFTSVRASESYVVEQIENFINQSLTENNKSIYIKNNNNNVTEKIDVDSFAESSAEYNVLRTERQASILERYGYNCNDWTIKEAAYIISKIQDNNWSIPDEIKPESFNINEFRNAESVKNPEINMYGSAEEMLLDFDNAYKSNGLRTERQAYALEKYGYNCDGWTIKEAAYVISKIQENYWSIQSIPDEMKPESFNINEFRKRDRGKFLLSAKFGINSKIDDVVKRVKLTNNQNVGLSEALEIINNYPETKINGISTEVVDVNSEEYFKNGKGYSNFEFMDPDEFIELYQQTENLKSGEYDTYSYVLNDIDQAHAILTEADNIMYEYINNSDYLPYIMDRFFARDELQGFVDQLKSADTDDMTDLLKTHFGNIAHEYLIKVPSFDNEANRVFFSSGLSVDLNVSANDDGITLSFDRNDDEHSSAFYTWIEAAEIFKKTINNYVGYEKAYSRVYDISTAITESRENEVKAAFAEIRNRYDITEDHAASPYINLIEKTVINNNLKSIEKDLLLGFRTVSEYGAPEYINDNQMNGRLFEFIDDVNEIIGKDQYELENSVEKATAKAEINVLRNIVLAGSGFEDSKFRINEFYSTNPDNDEFAEYLKKEYGVGESRIDGVIVTSYHNGLYIQEPAHAAYRVSWNELAEQTADLIDNDAYITQEDIDARISTAQHIIANYTPENIASRLEWAHRVINNDKSDKDLLISYHEAFDMQRLGFTVDGIPEDGLSIKDREKDFFVSQSVYDSFNAEVKKLMTVPGVSKSRLCDSMKNYGLDKENPDHVERQKLIHEISSSVQLISDWCKNYPDNLELNDELDITRNSSVYDMDGFSSSNTVRYYIEHMLSDNDTDSVRKYLNAVLKSPQLNDTVVARGYVARDSLDLFESRYLNVINAAETENNFIDEFKAKTDESFNNIDDNTAQNIEELTNEFTKNILEENNINAEVVESAVFGSRSRGKETNDSDLDVVVEIKTDTPEEKLSELLHETEVEVGGIKLDITPIREEETGTLETYLPQADVYMERELISSDTNAEYTIYQLKSSREIPENHYVSFTDTEFLNSHDIAIPDISRYNEIWKGSLNDVSGKNVSDKLDTIYQMFNTGERPEEFKGHSLSVSDVIDVNNNGNHTAYYVDSIGFTDVTNTFFNIEMMLDQNKSDLTEKETDNFRFETVKLDKYDFEVDFNKYSSINLETRYEEYLGGYDSDGHERKDNYKESVSTFYYYRDGNEIIQSGNDIFFSTNTTDLQTVKEELEKFFDESLYDADKSVYITTIDGKKEYVDVNELLTKSLEVPFYTNDREYAHVNGEIDEWRNSRKENKRVAQEIDSIISSNYTYETSHFDSEKSLSEIYDKFDPERVKFIMAEYISDHGWDGRYDTSSKEWAKSYLSAYSDSFIDENKHEFYISAHATLINSFVNEIISNERNNANVNQTTDEEQLSLFNEAPSEEKAESEEISDVNDVLYEIPKDIALEYWNNGFIIYLNGKEIEDRLEIENAQEDSHLAVSEKVLLEAEKKEISERLAAGSIQKEEPYTLITENEYYTDTVNIFRIPKTDGVLLDVDINVTDELMTRLANAGLIPVEDSLNRVVFETDFGNWNKLIIPDRFGNRYNSIDAIGVLNDMEYAIAMQVSEDLLNADNLKQEEYSAEKEIETEEDIEDHADDTLPEIVYADNPRERIQDNIDAISIMKELENRKERAESRGDSSDTIRLSVYQEKTLRSYVGWGGLPQVFDEDNTTYSGERARLKYMLTDEEYKAARSSTLNAHYTSQIVIDAMYEAIKNMDLPRDARILEPACGTGNFITRLPASFSEANVVGVELDPISSKIASWINHSNENVSIINSPFEKSGLENNSFDLAIGNVPFGNYELIDPDYKDDWKIHDAFFRKSLDKVAPGGVVAFITSTGTMDKKNPKVREYLAKKADLIGAIRLPDNAFADAGTKTATDIIFLKKRENPLNNNDKLPDWCYTTSNEEGLKINSYYVNNPNMILGKMEQTTHFNMLTCSPIPNADLNEQLKEAIRNLNAKITVKNREAATKKRLEIIEPWGNNYTYQFNKNGIFFRIGDTMEKIKVSEKEAEKIKKLCGLRDATRELINLQRTNIPDEQLIPYRDKLNELYDTYVDKYGSLTKGRAAKLFKRDNDYPIIQSLENVKGDEIQKADIFFRRTVKPYAEVKSVEKLEEAINFSLDRKGKLDIPYMTSLLKNQGYTEESIVNSLIENGHAFYDPEKYIVDDKYSAIVEKAEYLSGNVRRKLTFAEQAAQYNDNFKTNVEALKQVIPEDIKAEEISAQLGCTWIDPEDYTKFLQHLSGRENERNHEVTYSSVTGEFSVNNSRSKAGLNINETSRFGTNDMSLYHIADRLLNQRRIIVQHTYEDPETGKKKTYTDARATKLALDKAKLIKQEFNSWIFADPARKEKYERKYNDIFNSIVGRNYDGSHLTFSGLSSDFVLRQHQKDCVARTIYGGNTLAAHVVGAGKSAVIITSVMKKKELGLINKACVVVPKALTEQTANEWLKLYPDAKVLTVTSSDLNSEENRELFTAKVATGAYDAVIMSQEQYEKLPMSSEHRVKYLQKKIDELEDHLSSFDDKNPKRNPTVKEIEERKNKYKGTIEKLTNAKSDTKAKDDLIEFEALGFDYLVVDEAHAYKNGYVLTKMSDVAGVTTRASGRAEDMQMKTDYFNNEFGQGHILFATGTPVSNSMTELYVMTRYLRPDLLKDAGVDNFDDWASTFGSVVTKNQQSADGRLKLKTKFASFTNLPELMAMYKEFADIQSAEKLNLPKPKLKGEKIQIIKAECTPEQKAYVKELAERAERFENGNVDPSVDNHLKITGEARLVGLGNMVVKSLYDKREEELPAGFTIEKNSKVDLCVQKVAELYKQTEETKGVQIIFSDIAVNSEKGNVSVYEYIKNELINEHGVPEDEIVFAPKSDSKNREQIFADINNSKYRVVIASTSTLGTGANIQQNLYALHNLDIPWKPSDFEQRQGRILRQGNKNPEVEIFNYITEGTLDSYLYQTVTDKSRFIAQLMDNKAPARVSEDCDEKVLTFAEIQAAAEGNPDFKRRIEISNEIAELTMLKNEYARETALTKERLEKYPSQIQDTKEKIEMLKADVNLAKNISNEDSEFKIQTHNGKILTERKDINDYFFELIQMKNKKPDEPTPTFKVDNFKVSVRKNLSVMNNDEPNYEFEVKSNSIYSCAINNNESSDNCRRLQNLFSSIIPKKLEQQEKLLNTLEENQKQSEARVATPFAHEEELEKLNEEFIELEDKLSGLSEQVEDIANDEDTEFRTESETKNSDSDSNYDDEPDVPTR